MRRLLSLMLLAGAVSLSASAQRELTPKQAQQLSEIRSAKKGGLHRLPAKDLSAVLGDRAKSTVHPAAYAARLNNGLRRNVARTATGAITPAPTWTYQLEGFTYANPFSTTEFNSLFTIIDANGDATSSWSSNGKWTTSSYAKTSVYYYYHSNNNADDWLITPAFNLKAGAKYEFTFRTAIAKGPTSRYYDRTGDEQERLEVKLGTDKTAEAMTETLFPATVITNTELENHTVTINPTADGIYYIGFHALSDAYAYQLFLGTMTLTAIPDDKSPGAVTNISIEPEASGKMEATVTFTMPTIAYDGSELTSVTGVKIYNNGEEIADLLRVAPGKTMTFTDPNVGAEAGEYTYKFIAYNDKGDGRGAEATAWIGADVPYIPSLYAEMKDNATSVALSWDEAVAAHGGKVFDASQVTYDIYKATSQTDYYGNVSWGANIEDKVGTVTGQTSYDVAFDVDGEGEQEIGSFAVHALNAAGALNDLALGWPPILIGKSYELPFKEQWSGGNSDKFWDASVYGNGGDWADIMGVTEEDADGITGSIRFRGYNNDLMYLETGKITLAGSTAPKLVFQRKFKNSAEGAMYVVVENAAGEQTMIHSYEYSAAPASEWETVKADLSAFVNERYIRIIFIYGAYEAGKFQQAYIDNIHVAEVQPVDIAVEISAAANSVVKGGDEAWLYAKVINNGDEDVDAFKLTFKMGDEVVKSYTVGDKLPSFGYRTIRLTAPVDNLTEGNEITATVEVAVSGDADETNNTATATIALEAPEAKPVTGLAGTVSGEDEGEPAVALTWTAPVPTKRVTESFETYTPWSISNIGDWTLVDRDHSYNVGMLSYQNNFFTNEGDPFAFIVFDASNYGGYDYTRYFAQIDEFPNALPRTGELSLMAFGGVDSYSREELYYTGSGWYDVNLGDAVDADNWLISPELGGMAQTVEFYAANHTNDYDGEWYNTLETVDVLYSTTDNNPDSFTKVGETIVVDNEAPQWQKITFDIPEGAKYFAINHNTKVADSHAWGEPSPFYLNIDDISFDVFAGVVSVYRIYRDGELIAETDQTEFTDTEVGAEDADHLYQVVAVYTDGSESEAVSVTIPVATAIERIIGTAEPFDVYTIDGRLVRQQTLDVTGLRGLYIINNKKVILK